MKKVLYLILVTVFVTSCSSNKFTREKAAELIKKNYPQVSDGIYIAAIHNLQKKY